MIQNQSGFFLIVGRSGTVAKHNLEILGVSLNNIQYIVLSHGHTGYVDGARYIGVDLTESYVVLHPRIFNQKFKLKGKEIKRSGNQPSLERLKSMFSVKTTTKPMLLSGEIPIDKKNSSSSDTHYFVEGQRDIGHDLFKEELALGIKTRKGIIVLISCAHRGVVNTVNYVLSLFPGFPLFGIIGGFHFLVIKIKPLK